VQQPHASPESIGNLGVREVAALLAEGDPFRKSPQDTDDEIDIELWIVLAKHASPWTTDELSVTRRARFGV
jgi:hypothetical protein